MKQASANPKTNDAPGPTDGLSVLLQLEAEIRALTSEEELGFHSVNATRKLLNHRQAFVFKSRNGGKSFKLFGASSLRSVDRTSPFVVALEKVVKATASKKAKHEVVAFELPSVLESKAEAKETFPFKHGLWAPMHLPDGTCFGGLLFVQEMPWPPAKVTIADRLRRMYAYAWAAVVGKKRLRRKSFFRRFIPLLTLIALVGAAAIKVPQTVVAPAEIVARNPDVVAAPIRGVVRRVLVQNEQAVSAGDILVEYEDAALLADLQVAQRVVNVAQAQLQRAEQLSFTDPDAKREVAVLQTELELRQSELGLVEYKLKQSKISAPNDGVALIADPDIWTGRAVEIGERIISIAKADEIEIKIELALTDAVALRENAPVRVFLDVDPLTAHPATLVSSDFNATPTDTGELAYKTIARFEAGDQATSLRIGLRGAAQISGQDVRLGFLVFRRPIAAFRQYFGV